MNKTVFRSRIDWYYWLIVAFLVGLTVLSASDGAWVGAAMLGALVIFMLVMTLDCRYVIDGDELVVYQLMRPTRLPISKISSVRKTTGRLASAAMSSRRVSISFADRSVLKSYAPLEISPKDRDAFIARLLEVNPAIVCQP